MSAIKREDWTAFASLSAAGYREAMHNDADTSASPRPLSRRDLLAVSAGSAAALLGAASVTHADEENATAKPRSGSAVDKGRIKQTVCQWCYKNVPLEELAAASAEMGLVGMDLIAPSDFPTLTAHGLVCSMTPSHGITKGLNDPANWDACLEAMNEAIEATAAAGFKNVICFSGNRGPVDDRQGLKNCAEALRKITPTAEKAGVVLQMELLNSKVNHKGYMCDTSPWGVELVKEVASDNFRLLYDIYHMQIMEGDVIRTIERDHEYFGHYHTAGNPGRHELDDSQELNYPPIIRAIIDTGFDGFLGQEFIPKRDPLTSLREAVELCDV